MADNPYVNKVQFGNNVLIDLTEDTASENHVLDGYTFHNSAGEPTVGALITHAVYDGLDSTSTEMALSANQGKILAERTSLYADTISSLKSFVNTVNRPYVIHCGDNCTSSITNGKYGGQMVILAYLTASGYIVYIGQCGSGQIINGWVQVSTNVATVSSVPTIHRKRIRFNDLNITSTGYIKLCTYSQIGISGPDNIVSIRVQSGNYYCAVSFEFYDDGIYMYSSKELSNKYVTLDIMYNPWATPVYDSDQTITVS